MKHRSRGGRTSAYLLLGFAVGGCQVARTASPDPHPAAPLSAGSGSGPTTEPPLSEAFARGEDRPGGTPTSDDWRFTASLYLWLASKTGVVETGNATIALDDPDESTGAFLYIEGERGAWGFIADLDLLSSEDQADSIGGTIEIDEDTVIAEVDATYRPQEDSALQFLGGLRVLDSSQDIRFPILTDVSTSVTQVDPVLGAQGTWALGKGWKFRLRGDVGGFGLDSDLTYQMLGVFGWEFAQAWQLTAGYRILGWEFEADDVRNDLQLAGALFGVAVSF